MYTFLGKVCYIPRWVAFNAQEIVEEMAERKRKTDKQEELKNTHTYKAIASIFKDNIVSPFLMFFLGSEGGFSEIHLSRKVGVKKSYCTRDAKNSMPSLCRFITLKNDE